MPTKCLLLLLDGLGDRGHDALNGRTPLQAARTPVFDSLAKAGGNGLFHASVPGQALPSELAHLLMFGYPEACFPGRGPLEALGAGIPMGPEDVAVMARLVHAKREDGRLRLIEDTPFIKSPDQAEDLASCLPHAAIHGLEFSYHHIQGLHGLLVIRSAGAAPSPHFTDTNPIRDGAMLIEPLPLAEASGDPDASRTAEALKQYLIQAREALRGHPANAKREQEGLPPVNTLATQRAGRPGRVSPFARRHGLKAACLASGKVYRGLAKFLGMDFIPAADSGDPGADLGQRLAMARSALAKYDFIHLHTKAPDEAAHTGDCLLKRDVIEALDQGAGDILPELAGNPDLLVVVTADHSTPSSGGLIHSGEPVPLIMHGKGVRLDAVARFDEVSAAAGCLGLVRGQELMLSILNLMDKARLKGLRDCPDTFEQIPAWPGPYQPFSLD